ncbi:DUF4968 domain-containing protein [Paenibacillus oenotherae]|uniref:DUF4968 domain-containing protein n=1 Tax=Paenibacillus oenotherae TaxID=1435645 RepID=A0ABS7D7J4_9BACL|nr:TIM-barrel domain-containing protein [Paenibacillus oenotherae]MBW7475811.1 DUF4968 domain-containing protein [Paenibacillus oenotherae]
MTRNRGKLMLIVGGITLAVIAVIVAVSMNRGAEQDAEKEKSAPVVESASPSSDEKALSVVKSQADGLELSSGKDVILIDVVQADALRVRVNPGGAEEPDTEVIGTRDFAPVGAVIDAEGDPITVKTDQMKVEINKKDRSITVYDAANKLLLKQADILLALEDELAFTHDKNDSLYGISGYQSSEISTDGMLRASSKSVKGGMQGHAGAPFVWSTAGYGLLVDTIDAEYRNSGDTFSFSNLSKKSPHYYFIVGNPPGIMSTAADISGKPPLFPKWALGFMNSEWGIDEKELLQHVTTYRQKGIPIDSFSLDFDWKAWGEDQYGEFRWNEKKFPNGSSGKLKETLDGMGIKLTGIFKPRIHVDTEQGRYATEHNFWWPNKPVYPDYFSNLPVNDLDFSIDEVRQWYFEHAKQAFDTGIIGWWNDEADEGYTTTQFIDMQKGLYEEQRKYSDKRVWSLNRNFYLGAQKYAYGLWSGDISSGFKPMAEQRERMLSAVNVGQAKWGMDTGGFQTNPQPDNYARWMQFSAFTPIFRVHGKLDHQRQPWFYGEQAEAAAKAAIELRYKLIPYIYSYERRAYESGLGLVKPLMMDYPQDPAVANLVDSWMFGDWLLVSPVVTEAEPTKPVYLPQGTWIDYANGTVYEGGQTITHQVDLKNWTDIPLFIKKGAIIPSQPVMNYIGENKVDTVTVDVFPDTVQTSFHYYDDDGATYQYEQEHYFKQTLSAQQKDGGALFHASSKAGTYTPELQYYMVAIHGIAGKNVTINSSPALQADSLNSLAGLKGEGWFQGKDVYGDVTYVKIEAGNERQVAVE